MGPSSWKRMLAPTFALALALAPASNAAIPEYAARLEVRVVYEGTGVVDDEHRLWLFLWRDAELTGMPLAMESLARNGGTVAVSGLPASDVFVTVVYDVRGGYDPARAMGPPPADSPRAAYLGDPPGREIAPVTPDPAETVTIEIRFGGDSAPAPSSP